MDTIDNMRAFLAVAETGNFTRAAEKLDQSTNMVSKKVAALEARLAVRLFNRTTRHVSLTETGRSYAEDCRRLIEDFDTVERTAMQAHTSPAGHLKISAAVTFGERHVSPATARFLQAYPDITAEVCLADRFVDIVAEGFDVAIRIGKLDDSSVIAKRLGVTDLLVCSTPEYLAEHGNPEKPEDLNKHACVIDTNLRTGDQWRFGNGPAERYIKVAGRLKVNGAEAARTAVLAGAGIAYCPHYAVADDLKAGRIVRLFEKEEATQIGIYALYPHNRHLATKVCSYIRFLTDWFAKS